MALVRKVENGQSPVCQHDASSCVHPGPSIIGASERNPLRHGLADGLEFIRRGRCCWIKKTCNPTHVRIASSRTD